MDSLTAKQVDAAWLRIIGEVGFSMSGFTMTDEMRKAFENLATVREQAGLEALEALAGYMQGYPTLRMN